MGMKRACALALAGAAGLAAGGALAGEAGGDPRIGEEVRRVCFASSISNWATLRGEDNVVLLERRRNEWYRAELIGHCREHELRSAQTIALDVRPAGACVSAGDAILFRAPGDFVNRCRIGRLSVWRSEAPAPSEES